jgi:hypothetical protein
MFGKYHEEPQPKDERELSAVEETLNYLNRLDSEATQRIRHGARRSDTSVMILMDKVYEQQRKLLHEYDVIPVVDERTGRWKLFS